MPEFYSSPRFHMKNFFNFSLVTTVLFLIAASLISHALFSGLGFNPTDDGFILAYSRRLLDGQIPHRDFISIRPVGSALLHAPLVAWGGNKVIWYSRLFVWFELACVAWIWVVVLARSLRAPLSNSEKICLAGIAFALSANTFPIMAWHTIDGIFFISLGLALVTRRTVLWQQLFGYFLIGVAYLCKQNFLIIFPLVIIALGDLRKLAAWLAALLPGILYVSIIIVTGGISEMIIQLTVQTSLFDAGFLRYFKQYAFPWGILAGYLGMMLLGKRLIFNSSKVWRVLSLIVVTGLITGAGFSLVFQDRFTYADQPAFLIFGLAVGIILYGLMNLKRGSGEEQKNFMSQTLVVLVAWAASLSIGSTTPVLLTGPLAIFCILNIWPEREAPVASNYISRPIWLFILIVLTLLTLGSFIIGRHKYIYRDLPAPSLVKSLDGVFPGAQAIKTNTTTFALLADLNQIIRSVTTTHYSILPDFAGYWVKSPISNSLPLDWPIDNELSKTHLFNWVTKALLGARASSTVIIEKYDVSSLPTGNLAALDADHNTIVNFVKQNFKMVGETKYFKIYR